MLVLSFLMLADPALATLVHADARVAAIAWRLQTANADLCPAGRVPGFFVQSLNQYAPAQRAAIAIDQRIGFVPTIVTVFPASDAAHQGLMAGDAVVAVDGERVAAAPAPLASYAAVAGAQIAITQGLARGRVTLTIDRAGKLRAVTMTGDHGCGGVVEVIASPALNARADQRHVQVTAAMVTFAATDDDLAQVIAHELAHVALGHRATDVHENGRDGELAADRLAIWFAARAGFDLSGAVSFWARLRDATRRHGRDDGTHPGWARRIAGIADAVATVAAQRAAGTPLVPPTPGAQQTAFPARNPR